MIPHARLEYKLSEIKSKIEYIKNNKPNLTIEINRKGTWNIYDRTNSPIPILKEVASESVAKDIISNPSKYEKSEPTKYVAKRGDTYSLIAKKYDVDLDDLKKWNRQNLVPGMKVVVYQPNS